MIRLSRARSERGAVFVFVTGLMVVLILVSGLAVDLGRQRALRRSLQADADVIALDLVRLIEPSSTATGLNDILLDHLNASRERNGLPAVSGFSDLESDGVLVEWGRLDGSSFTPAEVELDAVRVTLTEDIQYLYLGRSSGATRSAVASVGDEDVAGFTVGSRLASVDTAKSDLLNPVLSRLLGSNVNLTAADYNNLVGANVSLLDLLGTPLIRDDLSIGTPDELLDTDLSVAQLMLAQIQALENQDPPNTAAANVLRILSANVPAVDIPVASLLDVETGAEEAAAIVGLDVFELVMSSLYIANGSNAISIPNLAVAVPGVTRVDVSLSVTERPRVAYGPEGTTIQTAQVRLTVTPTIPINLNLGVARVVVTAAIPITVEVGGATGTLTAINCGTPPGIEVSLGSQPVVVGLDVNLLLSVETFLLLGWVELVGLRVEGDIDIPTNSTGAFADFEHTVEFLPPVGSGTMTETPPPNLGLNGALQLSKLTVTPTLVGISLPLPLGDLVGPVLGALNPALGLVDNLVIQPLTNLLGIQLGGGDLGALDMQCGFSGVALVG